MECGGVDEPARIDREDADAEVQVAFIRPTHGGFDLVVDVPHHYGGRYLHDVALPLAGAGEARVHIVALGREYRLRERIHLEP